MARMRGEAKTTEGELTCVGDGATEITASMDGITSNLAVFIANLAFGCVSIAIAPTDPTISVGVVIDFAAFGTRTCAETEYLLARNCCVLDLDVVRRDENYCIITGCCDCLSRFSDLI